MALAATALVLPLGAIGLPEATAAANGVKVLSSSSFVDWTGQVHIVGEVANEGSSNVFDVAVGVDEKAANGSVIRSVPVSARLSIMEPGDKSPFILIFEPSANYDHYAITGVNSTTTYQEANHNFTISGARSYEDDRGVKHVAGSVTNGNGGKADWVQVLVTLHGATGKVVDAAVTSPQNNSSSSLEAGETADWDASFDMYSPTYVTVATIGQAANAPSGPPPPAGQIPDVTSFRIPPIVVRTSECQGTYPISATLTNSESVNQVNSAIQHASRTVTWVNLAPESSGIAHGMIWYCPRDFGLGTFRVGPSTINYEYGGDEQSVEDDTAATFHAKQESKAKIAVSRSGAVVTAYGRVRYFSVAAGARRQLHHVRVYLQQYSRGAWREVAHESTGAKGTAVFRITAPSDARWRIVYRGSRTTWKSTSRAVDI